MTSNVNAPVVGDAPAAKKRSRSKSAPDAIAAEAVDLARDSLAEIEGEAAIGEHLSVAREGDRLVVHTFAAELPGYVGWEWKVLVSRASRARVATVCDSWLEPGSGSIVAPSWVPWAQRLKPEDVSPTDRLPYVPDDDRLMPGYAVTADADEDAVALFELGLGRPRVLSPEGRDDASNRWEGGAFGPSAKGARFADDTCSGCGFYIPLAGTLRTSFGVCANKWSTADGHVISAAYGCGAHSETDQKSDSQDPGEPILDEVGIELM